MEYNYKSSIQTRTLCHKIIGLLARLKNYIRFSINAKRLTFKGTIVGKNTCINRKVKVKKPKGLIIGKSALIGKCILDARGTLKIGNHCIINDEVEIITATHKYNSPQWEQIGNGVVIEDYAWLATGCKILPGVKIGYGAIVGVGAIVTKDIPKMGIAVGNPAVVKKYRKAVHDGLPTEVFNGADLASYYDIITKGYYKKS